MMDAQRLFIILILFLGAACSVVAQETESRGCEPREPHELRNSRFLEDREISRLSVSPNPSSGSFLTVRYDALHEAAEILLADPLGHTLRLINAGDALRNDGAVTIEINDIPAGNYFLRLKTGAGVETRLVTIAR